MRILRIVLVLLLLPAAAGARTAAELQLALKKLTVLGSALYVAAHPDDENTAMLAWLANERLVRAGYLSVTRGDGGQNLIGEEKSELLGVIRTQELLAARRIDGAEQFFTRAIDFGYSKTATETLSIWDRNSVLADVVWTIRKFQPDVIVTRFPSTGEGGHGQHTASAILAEEAFNAAADPTKFPEQLRYVSLWQPKRIFWNRFSFRPLDPNAPELANDIRIDLGTYNPLMGRAYTEIAAESRSEHKSQGFGSAERRGTVINYFKQTAGAPAQKDIFEGIDLSWSRYPGGERVGGLLQRAHDEFDPASPAKSIPLLLEASDELTRLGTTDAWARYGNPWIELKRRDLEEAIRECAGISIDVSAAASTVIPGAEIPVSVTVVNRSDYPFSLSTVASPYANPGQAPGTPLRNNQPVKTDITIKVPEDFTYSQPYWLGEPPTKGMFTVTDQTLIGRPENPPAIPIVVSLDDNAMHTLVFTVPAVFRWTDPVQGGQIRTVDIVPEVVANFDSGVYLFPDAKPRPVSVRLRSFSAGRPVTARLILPAGWKSEPVSAPVQLEDEAQITFRVTPPASQSTADVVAEVELQNGRKIRAGVTAIDYPHIPAQRLFSEPKARLVRVDVKKRGTSIGYIMGSGDYGPDALRQIGYTVTLLTDADLDRGDFSKFDAVVAGVRAYNTRRRLRLAQPKLMQYVEEGGTLVVQYNTVDDLAGAALGPYPFKISRDRVSVEEAPVKMLMPSHPLLTRPNRITASDFEGWVQERGLYFTSDWDPKYETVISSNDPGEPEKPGGQIFARHGKGVFVYTSYSWFRQLPAGVPGAYKLFANLVSAQ
ncbi:MAG TPA: PIG-L family deacetylase [Thermoanaerobaculia bacterium]|nr:PIG-L family deacetylase [Thermoanaerobaculia bacterium]